MQQFTYQIGCSVYVNYEGALFVCLCLSVCVWKEGQNREGSETRRVSWRRQIQNICENNRLDSCFHFVVVSVSVSHVSCTRDFFLISPLDFVLTQVWPKTPAVNISVYTWFETRPPLLPSQLACLLSTLSRLYARMTLWLSMWPAGWSQGRLLPSTLKREALTSHFQALKHWCLIK